MWNLTQEDEGWYHCLITYMNRVPEDMPSPNGTWVYLSILSKPKLTSFSEPTLILKEGDHLSLFCKASGTPAPEISWFRDGFPIGGGSDVNEGAVSGSSSSSSSSTTTTDGRVYVDGESLRIYHVLRRDAGVYVCRASNSVGEAKHEFKVVLQGGVFIMTVPMNQTVREGRRVQLECGAEARPSNITYKWTKREPGNEAAAVDVNLVEGLGQRVSFADGGGTLVISSAFGSDSGWYYCSATNGLSSATAKAFLNVTFPPKLLQMRKILYLPKNNAAEIKCRADANPPVSHVDWKKNGEPLRRLERHGNMNNNNKASRRRVNGNYNNNNVNNVSKYSPYVSASPLYSFINNGLSIYLPRASSEYHEGDYTCMPFNSLGFGVESEPMKVLVRDPPRFKIRPRRFEQKMLKDSVTFRCDAEGDPAPEIEWKRVGGKGLPNGRAVQAGGNITIANLVYGDAGRLAEFLEWELCKLNNSVDYDVNFCKGTNGECQANLFPKLDIDISSGVSIVSKKFRLHPSLRSISMRGQERGDSSISHDFVDHGSYDATRAVQHHRFHAPLRRHRYLAPSFQLWTPSALRFVVQTTRTR